MQSTIKFIFLICLCLSVLENCNGIRKFRNGRRFGGNLGDPSKNTGLQSDFPTYKWFEQLLDHFDPLNAITWQQRYYVNDEFYNPGGPVFLMIGGEGEATAKWMHEGAWIHYAKIHHALCFQLEHRYYGESHPTPDLSSKNLAYLSSEQALADISYFIKGMNKLYKLNENTTKWISFGGSYPGSLAAWLREKYPHLVHGSISSSGPLLAKADFVEYYDVVTYSLGTFSEECVNSVRKGYAQIDTLLKHMIGQRSLNDKFKLCTQVEQSINNSLDITNLYEAIASNFAGVVQYNKDNSPHATVTIDDVCNIMTNTSIGAPVHRLAEVNALLLKVDGEPCLDYKYQNMVDDMREFSWDSKMARGGARQWTYQTCTEFGFYQTTEDEDSLFGNKFPLNFFAKQCYDIYGPKFNTDVLINSITRTNLNYGALNPSTTNVLYIHGSIDPWHALGLTSSDDPGLPTIYIDGTAHCANMYEPAETDPKQLKDARIKINEFITNLLK